MLFAAVLIMAAGAAAYWNSLNGAFIWDDETAILTNQTIRHLWPLPGPLAPPAETPVAGRPVVNLSLAVNYALGGVDTYGYHLWNIGVHLICALVLFGIVRRTLDRVGGRLGTNPGSSLSPSMGPALAAALIWLLHPLQTEVVNYTTQRTESMMGLFFFLTLYCAIRSRDSVPTSRQAKRWTTASIGACLLGMATKESMVTAPLIVLLYDRAFEFTSIREAIDKRRSLYVGLAATWLALAAFVWHAGRSTVGASDAVSTWTYLLNQAGMIVRYLRLSLWPSNLVLDYGLPRPVALGGVAPQAAVVLALVAATLVALARWPAVGFLGAAFFITLAPTSSIVPIVSEVGAERRMYLPLAALVVLAVVGVRALIAWAAARTAAPARTRSTLSALTAVATLGVLGALAVGTAHRNADYDTPISIWKTVVDRRPQGRARMSYATELVNLGRHDEAMTELRLAVADYPNARFALGTELVAEGSMNEAVNELQTFIGANPNRSDRLPAKRLLQDVLVALAQASLQKGAAATAESQMRTALALGPADAVAHNLLGAALASQGKMREARTAFTEAVRLDPSNQPAQNNLARALGLADAPAPGQPAR